MKLNNTGITKKATLDFEYTIQEVETHAGTVYSVYVPIGDIYFSAKTLEAAETKAKVLLRSWIKFWDDANKKKNIKEQAMKPGIEVAACEIEYTVIQEEDFYDCYIPSLDAHVQVKTKEAARREVPKILNRWMARWRKNKEKIA